MPGQSRPGAEHQPAIKPTTIQPKIAPTDMESSSVSNCPIDRSIEILSNGIQCGDCYDDESVCASRAIRCRRRLSRAVRSSVGVSPDSSAIALSACNDVSIVDSDTVSSS